MSTAPPCSHWPGERSHTVPICVKVLPFILGYDTCTWSCCFPQWARRQIMRNSPVGSRAIAGECTFMSPGAMSTIMRSPPQVSP